MNSLSSPDHLSARDKVAAYLRACGLSAAEADRLGQAAVDRLITSADAPTELQATVRAVLRDLDAHAAHFVPALAGESPDQRSARGRAQMILAGMPTSAPEYFVSTSPSPELSAAVASRALRPTPPLRPVSMIPQPIDLGPVSEVADNTWRTFDKWPLLRAAAVCLLFLSLFVAAFYMVRF